MKLGADVIDRPTEEGARRVALALLAEGDRAAERLGRGDGAEALHDFRVAVRRLRSTLRTFRPVLAPGVGGKQERRLKKLARGTNQARDAEVQLAWLASQREALGSAALRPGIDFLVHRLEQRLAEAEARRARVVERYARSSRKLVDRLRGDGARLAPPDGGAPFAALLASLATEQRRALHDLLGSIRGAGDEPHVHAARIQGKRLRYLLEPLRGNPRADARAAVAQLKALQDVLGGLHDTHLLAQEVATALSGAAGERARLRPGLLAVARLLRRRRDALFGELDGGWRGGKLARLEAEIARLAAALEARGRPGSARRARPKG